MAAPTRVFFATNRKPDDPARPTDFTSEIVGDLDSFRVGTVDVDGTELYAKNLDGLAESAVIKVAPETMDPNDARRSVVGSDSIFAGIREGMLAGADAVLLIHGYDYTFRGAMARAAQVKQWLELDPPEGVRHRPLVMMAFSWPSLGTGVSPKTYHDDRRRAEASGHALGRAMLKAADFLRAIKREEQCLGSIHIMAHSMGNWALRGAVQAMRTFVGDNIPPLFNEVVLVAADEDNDTLDDRRKIAPLLRGCRRMTVYTNIQDAALKASDWAMGNPDRLGRSGPSWSGQPSPKVTVVNAAPVIMWDRNGAPAWQEDDTGHQYYRCNPTVRRDIQAVLTSMADDGIPGRSMIPAGYRLNRPASGPSATSHGSGPA